MKQNRKDFYQSDDFDRSGQGRFGYDHEYQKNEGSLGEHSDFSQESLGQKFKKMEKGRKTAFWVLSIFSVVVVVLSVLNIKNKLDKPFMIPDSPGYKSSPSPQTCTDGSCLAGGDTLSSSNMDLKLIDTDGDSISDWDELFVYGTSPYLEDSDGDGLSDYEEIFIYKTDPNCPQGQDCGSASLLDDEDFDGLINNPNSFIDSGLMGLLGGGSLDDGLMGLLGQGDTADFIYQQMYNMSPDQIRAGFLQAGISAEELEEISDDDLMDIYRESLSSL